jgi:hypothetical protein
MSAQHGGVLQLTRFTERLYHPCKDLVKQRPVGAAVIPIPFSQCMAKLVDCITWGYTRQLYHTHLDQSLRTKDYPDQRLLLALRSLPGDRHQLSHIDGLTKIFSTCSIVHTNTDLLQLW